jgi:hypothetical protein
MSIEDLLTERPALAIPRSGHNAFAYLVRKQQVFAGQLGYRLRGLPCPFDGDANICVIRAVESCRARQHKCSI